MANKIIRVIVADDHGIVREGVARILSDHDDIQIVGIAENGRSAIDLVHSKSPDVVVMDIGMPGLNGVDATKRIVGDFDNVSIVALSMHSDHDLATEVMRAGAAGFLVKDCATKELAKAIRTVNAGETYMCKKITDSMVDSVINESSSADKMSVKLSTREREVLQLIAEGYDTKDIAEKMNVSRKTVESHRRQMMNKLDISNIAKLTKYAIRRGITSVEY